MKKNSKLEKLRKRIDDLDTKIVDLLVKRYSCANDIGKAKQEDGTPVKDSDREDRVLKRVRSRTRKPLTKAAVERIYSAILKESRGMQSQKRSRKKS